MIEITVNGEPQTAPHGQTILGLLQQLELDPARVAVELDRRIVKQPHWPETVLGDKKACSLGRGPDRSRDRKEAIAF